MPEYSSTTITPADGVQVPSMNGSAAGNFLLSALRDYILASKGQANGLASLDGNGKLTAAQLPDLADDVIVVDSYSTLPAIGTASKIYITADNNKGYRWDPELTTPDYVKIFELDKSIVFGYYSSGSFYEDSEHTVQITPVEHVFYVDVSLADIYVLNDGTLIELLGTKWAKITDIQDGTITAGLATKAFQDAMGRAIITTYETKADASELKSAIEGNSQRIENLEVAVSGSLVQTNTDATMANTKTITNANEILPWAILKRVGARAVKFNQLMNKANYPASATYGNLTFTNNGDGSFTFSCPTALESSVTIPIEYVTPAKGAVSGHTYFLNGGATTINFGTGNGTAIIDNGDGRVAEITFGESISMGFRILQGTVISSPVTLTPMLCDLTTMNMASITASEFRSKFPASYYPYNAGEIIPLNPSAFKVVGWNKWDEETRTGYYNSNGEFVSYEWALANKNAIPAVPSTVYCMYSAIQKLDRICFYDASMNFISLVDASPNEYTKSFTSPSNCAYINFNLKSDYGITYLHNVCINISQSDLSKPLHDGVYEAYKETTIDTSFTSDYKYVNENCHDYSENVLVNGVMRREEHIICNSKTFNGASSEVWTPYGYGGFGIAVSDVKQSANNTVVGNVSANGFTAESYADMSSNARDMACAIHFTTKAIIFYVASITSEADWRTWLSTHPLTVVYEKATPSTPTLHDPIPNIPCEDGTTVQAVTPQADLVNAIDVPSTIAYMTKISS